MTPFIYDPNVTTPAELARRRAIAQAMLDRGGGGASSFGEGLAQLGSALGGRIRMSGVQRDEGRMKANATDLFRNALMGGGAGSVVPASAPLSVTAYAGKGKPAAGLVYANQGATRNLPLNPKLASALAFLPELGVTAQVFSGGQPAKGTSGRRTGSTRHDHGNSADVFFMKDGRKLDWSNPNDLPIFQEIVRRGRAAGLTGFGAGPGYMAPGSMHIGFGTPAVWGAGGKGANAPKWLREAFNGGVAANNLAGGSGNDGLVPPPKPMGTAMTGFQPPPAPMPQPQVVPVAAPPQAMPGASQQMARPSAYQRMMGNAVDRGTAPEAVRRQMAGASPAGGSMLGGIFGGGGQVPPAAPAPMDVPAMGPMGGNRLGQIEAAIGSPYFQYLDPAQQKFLMEQYEREYAAANPDPMQDLQRRKLEMEIDKMGRPEEVNPIVVDGNLVDPSTGRVIFSAPKEGPKPVTVGDNLVDPSTGKVIFAAPQKPDKPPAGVQEYEYYKAQELAAGRTPVDFFTWEKAKAPTTNVSVGGTPADDKLREELDKKEGALWSEYKQAAVVSGANAQDFAVLDELIKIAPQGPIMGRLAELVPGASSAGDAFQSVVKRIAPTLRAPGSGSTSDIEYDGMLRSLPALRNKPEANQMILAIMRAKADLNVKRAEVINAYQTGAIDAKTARTQIAELDRVSIMTPEMKRGLGAIGAPPTVDKQPADPSLLGDPGSAPPSDQSGPLSSFDQMQEGVEYEDEETGKSYIKRNGKVWVNDGKGWSEAK